MATIRWFEGEDRVLSHLATRVPFRGRGIARYLLSDFLHESNKAGCRSVLLFADPADDPIKFYRRVGFTVEIYWRGRYHYPLQRADG